MFIIQDWAGQLPFGEETFDTFEDAWDYLYETFTHLEGKEYDDTLSEFFVMPTNERLTELTVR